MNSLSSELQEKTDSQNAMSSKSSPSLPPLGVPQEAQGTVRRLVDLATRGLVPMFDQRRQLFCYSLKKSAQGMVQEGISPRYTMMTLMGFVDWSRQAACRPEFRKSIPACSMDCWRTSTGCRKKIKTLAISGYCFGPVPSLRPNGWPHSKAASVRTARRALPVP